MHIYKCIYMYTYILAASLAALLAASLAALLAASLAALLADASVLLN
jgi:hypothetical protein